VKHAGEAFQCSPVSPLSQQVDSGYHTTYREANYSHGSAGKTIQATFITGSKPLRQPPFSLPCRNGPPPASGFTQQLKFQRRSYLPGKAQTIYAYGELKTRMLQFCTFGIFETERHQQNETRLRHITTTSSATTSPHLTQSWIGRTTADQALFRWPPRCVNDSCYGVHTRSAGAARTKSSLPSLKSIVTCCSGYGRK